MARTADDPASVEALRGRLAGTNINPDTLLATDYLNHFNEIIMMLELVADMPEILGDAKAWKPLTYIEHFRSSQFADKDLAVEAYGCLPSTRREEFETAVGQTHARVATALGQFDEVVAAGGDQSRLRNLGMEIARDLHRLSDAISVIIHGGTAALDQPHIDGLFPDAGSAATIAQDDIDALFK